MINNTIDRHKAEQLLELTITKIDGAYAESTIRAYRSNFLRFIHYCDKVDCTALPAQPSTIASYIEKLTELQWRSASIRQSVASIATIHSLNNHKNPTVDPEVRLAIKRMHRNIGRFSRQANGITKSLLEKMVSVTDNSLRGYRDRALLLIAYDTMCRRSELTNIKVNDLDQRIGQAQSTVIFVAQSKTDQEANGRWLAISNRTSDAVNRWLEIANIDEGYLFRGINRQGSLMSGITSAHINRIYKKLAAMAGFDESFVSHVSGHSMRVGAAQDLLLSGASLPLMMAKGRWSKPDTVMRYIEKVGIMI